LATIAGTVEDALDPFSARVANLPIRAEEIVQSARSRNDRTFQEGADR
jgi:hypothetical protein